MDNNHLRITNNLGDIFTIQLDYIEDGYYFFIVSFENSNFKAKTKHSYYILNIKEYIENINNLNLVSDTDYNLKVQGYDSDDYLLFTKIDNLGHFELKGLLGGSFRDCYLNFKMKIDQTDLTNFTDYFKKNL